MTPSLPATRLDPSGSLQAVVVDEPPRRGMVSRYARALRAFSFPVSVLPVIIAVAAVSPVSKWRWPLLAAVVIAVVCLHAAGNLLNDYFDFVSGVDRNPDAGDGRPGRLLVLGELSPKQVLTEALICLIPALGAAGFLVWRCGGVPIAFGMAGLFSLYAYTGPPFHLKYRALGELTIFFTFGPALMIGAAFVQTGRFEIIALRISVPVGLAVCAILTGNNFRDYDEDRLGGVRTLAGIIGTRAAAGMYLALLVAPPVMLAGLAAAGVLPFALLTSPLILPAALKPIRSTLAGERLPDIDVITACYVTALFVFLAITLIVSGGA